MKGRLSESACLDTAVSFIQDDDRSYTLWMPMTIAMYHSDPIQDQPLASVCVTLFVTVTYLRVAQVASPH